VFLVKTLISHQMETGLRRDDQGNVIPRKIINKFTCRYNDVVVFSVDLHEAVAANPFIEFYLRATESGRLAFVWEEDGGGVYALEHQLAVA
jgi:sulfur-oxidizing protein SoxZ